MSYTQLEQLPTEELERLYDQYHANHNLTAVEQETFYSIDEILAERSMRAHGLI